MISFIIKSFVISIAVIILSVMIIGIKYLDKDPDICDLHYALISREPKEDGSDPSYSFLILFVPILNVITSIIILLIATSSTFCKAFSDAVKDKYN